MAAAGEQCEEIYTPLLSWLDDFSREVGVQALTEEDVLDVSDLRVDLPSVQVSKAVDNAWVRWRGIDRQRLRGDATDDQGKGKKRKRSSIKISIPRGFDYHTLEPLGQDALAGLSHPRIPEEIKSEYLGQMNDMFRALPRHRRLQREIDAAGLDCMRLKADCDPPVVFSESLSAVQHHTLSAATAADDYIPHNTAILQRPKKVVISFQFERPLGALQQEVNFLGTMTLQDVAKSISCLHDSDTEASSSSPATSFFFIGGVFYVARRLQSGEGSEGVDAGVNSLMNWLAIEKCEDTHEASGETDAKDDDNDDDDDVFAAPSVVSRRKSKGKGSKPHKSLPRNSRRSCLGIADSHAITIRNLEDVKLETVNFQLGCKSLYCHNGHCEHTFSIADVRLLHPHLDRSFSESCPCVTYKARSKVRVCEVCEVWSAEFVVYGDRLMSSHVSFFCKFCHHLMHYSKDGRLLLDQITVFPYLSDEA